VHTSHLGAPIVGDTLYGKNDGQKLMLHAGKLIFRHPVSGEKMCISSPIPERFKDVYEDF
jgi:23S rRNA-/tRNA-specific pseudouridylate synthase